MPFWFVWLLPGWGGSVWLNDLQISRSCLSTNQCNTTSLTGTVLCYDILSWAEHRALVRLAKPFKWVKQETKKRRDYTLRTLPKYCFCFQFTWTDWEIHERARDDRGTAGRGQSATYWTNKHTSLFAHDWQKKKTTVYLWQFGVSLSKTLIMHQSGEGVYVYVCIYGSRCFLYGYNVSPDLNISVLSQLKPTNSHLCNLIYCFIFLSSSFFHFVFVPYGLYCRYICFFKCQTENTQHTVTKPTICRMSLIPTCHSESKWARMKSLNPHWHKL